MRTIVSAAMALGLLAGSAGATLAQTDPSPDDAKSFYDQLDREGRGGQGN
jgi:hypothetical protein